MGETPKPPAQPVLPSVRNVALAPTPDFTGRVDELDKLRQLFEARVTGTAIVAIHGLGGIGKTQLALRYARSCAAFYDVVWWLRAEQPSTLATDFADLAAALRLPGRGEPDQRAAIEAVKHWLARSARWLLVFDSVRDPRDLDPYLVPGAPGQVLVTSRHASWVGIARLHLRELRREDAVNLLLSRSGVRDRTTQDQSAAAGQLADALGDLPLALAQAAAFMEEHAIGVDQYLALFRERQEELMRRGATGATAPTVATTWDIAFRELSARAPAAAELLALCAFLAPDDIPRDALRDGEQACPPALAATLRDPIALGDQIAALRRYSLIEAQSDALSVHRLVQSVVRERLSDDERRAWAECAVWLVNQVFPTDLEDPAVWPKCKRWLPHARVVAERAGAAGVAQGTILELYHRAARYSRLSGAFAEARELFRRAIALAVPLHGADHHEVGTLYRGLARTLEREGGDLTEARGLAERALAIHVAAVGAEHESVARDHHCLVHICRALGDRAAVAKHLEQMIAITEKLHGADDRRLIPLRNERGFLRREQGDLDGARRDLERALSIGEVQLGPEHPDVATFHSNLADILERQCLAEVQRLNQEGMDAIEARDTASAKSRAARVDARVAELADLARHHATRAVEIGEKCYGAEHYVVAIRRNNLGILLQSIGDLEGAHEQLERALAIGRRVLPAGHKRLLTFEKNLKRVETQLAVKSSRR